MSPALLQRRARIAMQAAPPARDAASPVSIRSLKFWANPGYSILKITTRQGVEGWGEGLPATREDFALLNQLLIGHAATAFEAVERLLPLASPLRGAVNMALVDISARMANVPMYQFLGGPTRYKVRVLAALASASDAQLVEDAKAALEQGYRAVSIPLPPAEFRNQGQQYILAVVRRLTMLREATGGTLDIVLNGERRFTPGDASMIAAAVERLHPLFFDEPCPASSLSTLARISRESVTPLGMGRSATSLSAFQDLLRAQAVDLLRPSLARFGISASRRAAAIAEPYYTAVAPHHTGGRIGTFAALQLAASLPNFFIQEVPLHSEGVTIREGFALLPKMLEVSEASFGKETA